jgi:hypothetical protein
MSLLVLIGTGIKDKGLKNAVKCETNCYLKPMAV